MNNETTLLVAMVVVVVVIASIITAVDQSLDMADEGFDDVRDSLLGTSNTQDLQGHKNEIGTTERGDEEWVKDRMIL